MAEVAQKEVVIPPKDQEEIELEKLVFGDLAGFSTNLKKVDNLYEYEDEEEDDFDSSASGSDSENEDQVEALNDDQLFFVDDGNNNDDQMDVDSNAEEEEEEEEEEDSETDQESDNAWSDSDDENIEISLYSSDKLRKLKTTEQESNLSGKVYIKRLRAQFEKIYPRPKWADEIAEEEQEGENDNEDEEDNAKMSSNALLKFLETNQAHNNLESSFKLLPQKKLDITRLKDGNFRHPSKSAIQTMSFHPDQPLLLTGGYDRTLRIYHIDGTHNNFVTSLHLRNSPIQSASFQNSNKIFAGGRRKYMYKWDILTGSVEKISRLYGHESTQRSFENFKVSANGAFIGLLGNSGWVNILNGTTGQWIKGFKIEGTLVDIDFSKDRNAEDVILLAVNSAGEVWEWNVESEKVLRKWKDDSGIGITKIKLGGAGNKWVAIGNNVGIVNVYDRFSISNGVKPSGVIENLVSTISSLEFSPDGQILAIGSRAKKDAFRLVHIPSFKVFSNWPTSGTPLGKVTSVCFSNGGHLLCVGNEQGKVRLWRLNHY